VLDMMPRIKSSPGSDAFPEEALLWRFEGWAQVQFDIGADGRTAEVRTLLGYPAFTFSRAATAVVTRSRFESTFRPDGAAGCGGLVRNVVFRLPG
jgi:outer membrane biosynthesis protein TonB